MLSNYLILCPPLLLLLSIFPNIRVFSNESVLRIRWLQYRSFSFSISPSNDYSGLISFMMNWLDILAIPGLSIVFSNITVLKASILRCSGFFIVQFSHPYMTIGKTMLLLLLLSCFSCVQLYVTTRQTTRLRRPWDSPHWSRLPFPSPMQESEK